MTITTSFTTQDTAFVQDFRAMSAFGATENGGVDRQAATIPDGEQRRWLAGLLEEHGFTVKFDHAGNQWGLYEAVPGAPYVVVGSHMDSQPTAGRYDGAYGVLAAAHAAFRLAARWEAGATAPTFNLAVVNWFNEEGSRFKPSMMGSSVYTGKLELEDALNTKDAAGVSVRDALDAIGCRGTYEGPEAAYCAEIHIEQGRSMERDGVTIGLVSSNWAANKYEFVVHGEQAHTGSTVIADRKDALLGASMLVVAARELADRFPGVLHTSVGQLNVYPNSPVVVPSRVNLLLDLRSADEAVLAEADALLHARITEIEQLANVTVEKNHSHSWAVTPYQPEGVELAAKVAADLGLSNKEVMTLAGHDSTNMKDIVPTVMLFVPSVDGISHNEHEYTTDQDIVAGLTMLTEVVARLCDGALENS
ncbi:M20 family metallo-hydrolase [Paenarthrobacter aurescens]|uniref:Zn-dependent hydrolase n=1 Tax=Paenarthrobacter aurescens TaxID=43663 RepID=A0A4Y3NB88_PAEAU|nr:M20 family metallo-hydrolase [Paenarthrobacter aurescens]MDO6142359.1 M20 family metallo-hydrolase [Paenarthrobacter aurescens]MDO6146206.1 M20 family metallo-hydrolase [Paenarthrobacter aurescens]MDO6157451.1 M20 family metallo-hydrolase [Paenarthrobacter aurescens]MDO6161436.1 M20 family metallo-hydrolase [Paenarthrobacter aurescens]GEB18922.1 Zn-dependent hydrolase [Paenarthrobacter aurescens]